MQRFYNILCLSIGCLVCLLSSCSIQPLADKISFESGSSPVSGYLHFPSSEGPHPVVIDLHGCDGILPARNQLWLPKLTGAGLRYSSWIVLPGEVLRISVVIYSVFHQWYGVWMLLLRYVGY